MPYIREDRRIEIEAGVKPQLAGELNYKITKTILEYLAIQKTSHISYYMLNEILGVLEAVKLEFYRRVVASYEDQKIKENGDVY